MPTVKSVRADDLPDSLQTLIEESEEKPSVPMIPLEPATPTKPFREPTQSIFYSVKKMLGIDEAYLAFDLDILTHINSVFFTLYQLGVGPYPPFSIDGPDEVWTDFLPEDDQFFKAVRTYVYQKVRLYFDPPTTGFQLDAINAQLAEMEWRFTVNPTTLEDYNGSEEGSGMREMSREEVRKIYLGDEAEKETESDSNQPTTMPLQVEDRTSKSYLRKASLKRYAANKKDPKELFR